MITQAIDVLNEGEIPGDRICILSSVSSPYSRKTLLCLFLSSHRLQTLLHFLFCLVLCPREFSDCIENLGFCSLLVCYFIDPGAVDLSDTGCRSFGRIMFFRKRAANTSRASSGRSFKKQTHQPKTTLLHQPVPTPRMHLNHKTSSTMRFFMNDLMEITENPISSGSFDAILEWKLRR